MGMRLVLWIVVSVAAVWLLLVAGLAVAGRSGAARDIAMFLPNLILLFRGLLRDGRVPRRSKWLLIVGLAWLVSPIDLIPEFIPVVGPLDDVIVAALLLRHVIRVAGREIVDEHWRGSEGSLRTIYRLAGVDRAA